MAGSEAYRQAIALGQAVGNMYIVLLAFNNSIQLQIAGGSLRRAYTVCKETIQFAAEHGYRQLPLLGQTYVLWGGLLYEWNTLEEAAQRLEQGISLGQQVHTPKYVVQGYMALARVMQAQGKRERAFDVVSHANELAQKAYPPSLMSQVAALRARLHLSIGDRAEAARWAKVCGLSIDDEPSYQRKFEYLTLARVLIAQGKNREVLGMLERLRRTAQVGGRTETVIETLVLQAQANFLHHQLSHAFLALKQALALAEPGGYIRLFVDEGSLMARLLAGYLAWQESQGAAETGATASGAYVVSTLLSTLEYSSASEERSLSSTRSGLQHPSTSHAIEPLGEREKEVLRYLAAGLSNQAIAAEMMVALSTVKSHLKSIYRKLDVENRTQAVAKARDLYLF